MSIPTTQPQPTGQTQTDIAAFVAAVRGHLDDLSADEVNELTGGLEADLTDALAEDGGTASQLYGHPAEYARELRSAAGLPPRSGTGAGVAYRVRRQLADDVTRLRARLETYQGWPALRDFLVVLQPAWWVLRAWVIVQVLLQIFLGGTSGQAALFRGGLLGFLLQVAAVVASVQLGRRRPTGDRRRWLASGRWTAAIALVNALALLLLPVALASLPRTYHDGGTAYVQVPPAVVDGLSNSGAVVRNVFPYDAQGRPLTGVQLYDQAGQPLAIGPEAQDSFEGPDGARVEVVPVPGQGAPDRWNVFPLQEKRYPIADEDSDRPVVAQAPQLPFGSALPVPSALAATPTPTATPTPAVTPKATATR